MALEDASVSSWRSLSWIPLNETVTKCAKRLVLSQLHQIKVGILIIHDFDGSTIDLGVESPLKVTLSFHSSWAWLRILLRNDVGFSEAYMSGEISCSNLVNLFRLMLLNSQTQQPKSALSALSFLAGRLQRLSNTSEQALLNARNHYSLSNRMFAAFLDPSMTYSAPVWLAKSDSESGKDTLEAAQLRKLRHTIDAARITSTDHVLEIGTGWGSFAIEAVRGTGCRVTTATASEQQALLARERIRDAGLSQRIEVIVCDYRQIPLADRAKRYDKVVSIEMIEHVGGQFLSTYFDCVHRYLKLDGGIGVFQCITIPEARYVEDQSNLFIPLYIFPGGHLPTVSGLVAAINAGSKGALIVEDVKSVSGHYVRALREWRENFLRQWEKEIEPALKENQPDFSERDLQVFKRKWEYYFCYCEAGFATKMLGDVSIRVGREGAMELIEDIPL